MADRGVQVAPRLGRRERGTYRRLESQCLLPPATGQEVMVRRDVPIPMRDGTVLLADHWYPAVGATGPTILVRTPYGRAGNAPPAMIWASRGRQVVVVRCRGTFGSGGVFDPLRDEADDGADTLAWLRSQDWHSGVVHTWGPSYLGATQWAMCGPGGPESPGGPGPGGPESPRGPDGMVIAQSTRCFDTGMIYAGGGLSSESLLTWMAGLQVQESGAARRMWAIATLRRRLRRAAMAPPRQADLAMVGRTVPFYQDWIAHAAPGDPWWEPVHFAAPPGVPPVVLVAGWQDLFLPGQVADYCALRQAGRAVRLIIGDWTHSSPGAGVASFEATFQLPLPGQPLEGPPVRFEVTGGGGWKEIDTWPPSSSALTLHLAQDGRLVEEADPAAEVSYRYDPVDPTPQAGGRTLNPFTCGRRDQRARESRPDVLVFTGTRLAEAISVIGEPVLELALASSNPGPDVMVRLCDVGPNGRSVTVGDGYARLSTQASGERRQASGGRRQASVMIGPIAHRFAVGHRIRLQVSSGAHPLHLRNPGNGPGLGDFSSPRPSDQTLFLGPDGCRLVAPVADRPGS